MAQQTTIVVANLQTLERYASQFEVECWSHPVSGARKVGLFSAAAASTGAVSGALSGYVQATLMMFKGLDTGSTYYFRDRVHVVAGGPPSPWSAATGTVSGWVTEVAGDLTAPNPSYNPSGFANSAGVMISANPSGNSSDFDHFEIYYALNNSTTPASGTAPTIPRSGDGVFNVVIGDGDTLYCWIRAVDTSGNDQAWVSLGNFKSNGAMFWDAESVENGNFENGSGTNVPGWAPQNAVISIDNITPNVGHSLKVVSSTQFGAGLSIRRFSISPGEVYKISGYGRSTGGSVPTLQFMYLDAGSSYVGGAQISTPSTSAWTFASNFFSVPSSGCIGQISLQNNSASGVGTCWFKSVVIKRVRGMDDEIVDGSVRKAMTASSSNYRPTTNPLTATDNGTNPVVTIAAFVMRVPNVGDVSINGGSVSATSGDYGSTGFIYYDDSLFAGGTVTFNLTFNRETALVGPFRFYVGSVPLPKNGGGTRVGFGDGGGGVRYSKQARILPTALAMIGTWVGSGSILDDDPSTYTSGGAGAADSSLVVSGYPGFTSWFGSNLLQVVHQVTQASTSGQVTVDYSKDGGVSFNNLRTVSASDSAPVTTNAVLFSTDLTSKIVVRFTLPATGAGSPVSGTKFAGGAADGGTGGTIAWVNPSNASGATNSSFAVASNSTLANTSNSNNLMCTGYAMGIPTGATMKGIKVTIVKSSNPIDDGAGNARYISDNTVQLLKAGVLTGTDKGTFSNWPSVPASTFYGGSADLWGLALTPADLNSTTFGVAISVKLDNEGTRNNANGSVDSVEITAYYTTAGGGGSSAVKIYDCAQVVVL